MLYHLNCFGTSHIQIYLMVILFKENHFKINLVLLTDLYILLDTGSLYYIVLPEYIFYLATYLSIDNYLAK